MMRSTRALATILFASATACAQGTVDEAVGEASQPLVLGPSTVLATNALGVEVAETASGYVVAYVAREINDPNMPSDDAFSANVVWLDAAGAIESGPIPLYTSTGEEVTILGVAWDGTRALVVTQREDFLDPYRINGHHIAPGGAPTEVFSQQENVDPDWIDGYSYTFGRPAFHAGTFWVSGMWHSNVEDQTCFQHMDEDSPGGYRVAAPVQRTSCGIAATGPGSPGVCVAQHVKYEPCTNTTTKELVLDTLGPTAPMVIQTPSFEPTHVATQADVVLVLGGGQALSLSTTGGVNGIAPVSVPSQNDVTYVVDRFLIVSEDAGSVHASTLDANGLTIVDPDSVVVADGSRPVVAGRQDGTALLAYLTGESLNVAVFNVTGGSSSTSSGTGGAGGNGSSGGGSEAGQSATGGSNNGGSPNGAGGAGGDSDGSDAGSDGEEGCSASGGVRGSKHFVGLITLLALQRSRRRIQRAG